MKDPKRPLEPSETRYILQRKILGLSPIGLNFELSAKPAQEDFFNCKKLYPSQIGPLIGPGPH